MKKSKCSILSAILGIVYCVYLIVYFSSLTNNNSLSSEAVGGVLAAALVTPHIICILLAAIFNTLGAILNKSGFLLTGGILYSVGGALFMMYLPFVIPMIILSFVGYGNIKKIRNSFSDI